MKTIKATREGRIAEKALRKAVMEVVEENRRRRLPIAVMQNGKAVFVSVEEAVKETLKENID